MTATRGYGELDEELDLAAGAFACRRAAGAGGVTIEVGIALAIFAALSGVFWKMYDLIQKAGDKGDQAQRELGDYKTHVAETYSTKAGMQEQTTAIMRAIEGVAGRIDGLHERLDRAFERQTTRTRS